MAIIDEHSFILYEFLEVSNEDTIPSPISAKDVALSPDVDIPIDFDFAEMFQPLSEKAENSVDKALLADAYNQIQPDHSDIDYLFLASNMNYVFPDLRSNVEDYSDMNDFIPSTVLDVESVSEQNSTTSKRKAGKAKATTRKRDNLTNVSSPVDLLDLAVKTGLDTQLMPDFLKTEPGDAEAIQVKPSETKKQAKRRVNNNRASKEFRSRKKSRYEEMVVQEKAFEEKNKEMRILLRHVEEVNGMLKEGLVHITKRCQ